MEPANRNQLWSPKNSGQLHKTWSPFPTDIINWIPIFPNISHTLMLIFYVISIFTSFSFFFILSNNKAKCEKILWPKPSIKTLKPCSISGDEERFRVLIKRKEMKAARETRNYKCNCTPTNSRRFFFNCIFPSLALKKWLESKAILPVWVITQLDK